VTGVDEAGVFRCQGEDHSTEKGTETACANGPAQAVHACTADEKVDCHIPGNACRRGNQPEHQALQIEKAQGRRSAFNGKAAIDELVPGCFEVEGKNFPKSHVGITQNPPVKLVDDVGSAHDLVGEQDLREREDNYDEKYRKKKGILFSFRHEKTSEFIR
jgi:hypothetical protein